MKVITAPTVNEALPQGLIYLAEAGEFQNSRAGEVIVAPGPVTTVYEQPSNKVLMSSLRDANPFFHLLESVWMLAGRNDAAFLNHYVKDFGERFAEPGGGYSDDPQFAVIRDAYGPRWRAELGYDQLDAIVNRLTENPDDRQCVLQMWDATNQIETKPVGHDDLCGAWRGRPCNTHIYFRLHQYHDTADTIKRILDMTVCCRSNDIIWGAYGANCVHMAFLLDYMAARTHAEPGRYYQISNNFHAYTSEIDRLHRKLGAPASDVRTQLHRLAYNLEPTTSPPGSVAFKPGDDCDDLVFRIIRGVEAIHAETVPEFLITPRDSGAHPLYDTVVGAARAHRLYRLGELIWAMDQAETIPALDWRTACLQWLMRRQ